MRPLPPLEWLRGRRRPAPEHRVGPRFEVVARTRCREVLSPGFVALEERPGWSEGRARGDWSPAAPYATVEVTLGESGGTVFAGFASDEGPHLLGLHDPRTGRVAIEIRAGGGTNVVAEGRVRRRVRRMAFTVCETKPTVLVDTGSGWRPVLHGGHAIRPRTDLRRPEVLAHYAPVWGSRGGPSDLRLVRAGLFGMAGLRDLHLVQHADGTPYVRDGRMFLTATCAGLGFFRQAHWGVFAFDPASVPAVAATTATSSAPRAVAAAVRGLLRGGGDGGFRLEQTAHLFSRRDGRILGDHAGQVVRDRDRWLVAVSTWGDFSPERGVFVRHTTSTEDLLTGVHVLDTEPAPMPTDRGCYDPGMTLVDGRWHVSYVESVGHRPSRFHPALAVGPAGAAEWTEKLERVGQAEHLTFCEGPILARPEGSDGPWRVLASDGHRTARTYRVFDLAMHEVGELDAPYGTNLPHPQVFDLPDGGQAMITFDGTRYAKRRLTYGTHGDVLVMRARTAAHSR
jgi:hypothetical protein